MQDAIEDKCIEALVNQHTNLLTGNVPKILDYLSHDYSKVYSEEVTQKDNKVMTIA